MVRRSHLYDQNFQPKQSRWAARGAAPGVSGQGHAGLGTPHGVIAHGFTLMAANIHKEFFAAFFSSCRQFTTWLAISRSFQRPRSMWSSVFPLVELEKLRRLQDEPAWSHEAAAAICWLARQPETAYLPRVLPSGRHEPRRSSAAGSRENVGWSVIYVLSEREASQKWWSEKAAWSWSAEWIWQTFPTETIKK